MKIYLTGIKLFEDPEVAHVIEHPSHPAHLIAPTDEGIIQFERTDDFIDGARVYKAVGKFKKITRRKQN